MEKANRGFVALLPDSLNMFRYLWIYQSKINGWLLVGELERMHQSLQHTKELWPGVAGI